MKGKLLAYVFVLSLALNAGGIGALAYRHFMAPPLAPRDCPFASEDQQRLYAVLGLSPEQRSALDRIATAFHAELRELRLSTNQQRDVLLALMEQVPPDAVRMQEAGSELASRQLSVQKAVMAHLLEVKSILTPAQMKLFFQAVRRAMNANG